MSGPRSMSGLVHKHGRLEPYSLLSLDPTEADECVGDVVCLQLFRSCVNVVLE